MIRIVKVFLAFIIFFITFILGIVGLSVSSDNNAYMLLLTKKKIARNLKNFSFNRVNTNDHSSATTGQGINLLLIDQLDEGYCKEMLTLFRDSADGKLDDISTHLSVTAFCGMQSNETGFYSGTHLLKSYLPINNKEVIWKKEYNGIPASEMSLYKVDAGVYSKGLPNNGIDGSGGETVFQFDPSMPSTAATKSNLDGATNSGRSGGDNKFLPDILTAVNNHFKANTDEIKLTNSISNMDTDAVASFVSLQHNRGGGGAAQYIFGIRYGELYTKFLSISESSATDMIEEHSNLAKLSVNYRDNILKKDNSIDPDIFMNADTSRCVATFLAVEADGWYVSPYAVEYFGTTKGLEIWNKMYPSNKVISVSDLKAKLKNKSKTVSEALKEVNGITVSSADVTKVYGTNGSYDDMKYMSSWRNCGSIFHVSKNKSSVYKNKYNNSDPYIISCYDTICAGHNVAVVLGGSYTYAYMLRLGGLTSVDPTNPETYMDSLKEEDTFSVAANSSWMNAYNVDESKLTTDRINVLTSAFNMTKVGAKYAQDTSTMDKEFNKKYIPTKIDCSGFVSKVFNNTGFTKLTYRHTTSTIFSDSGLFECIPKKKAKPGDIFCCDGNANAHVVIYLSGTLGSDMGNLYIIHSSTHGGVSGPQVSLYSWGAYHSITNSTSKTKSNTMYCFKINGIDSGNVKTEAWTKKGKKYR